MSPVIFGSMRMDESKGNEDYWAELLCAAYYAGIDTIHSSSEYESFPLLIRTLKRLTLIDKKVNFKHIVKLAEPHFSDSEYSSERLIEKINDYLIILQVGKLEAIQWMWRSNLSDLQRIESFTNYHKKIRRDIETLKQENLIGSALCFPYSVEFMKEALKLKVFDGFCVYRNPKELEYDDILKECDRQTVISIRPFSADKKLISSEGPLDLLNYNFADSAVKSTILSMSSLSQLNEIKGFINAKESF